MKIAAIQMVSSSDVAANCASARALLAQAAAGGAEMAVLPEYFCLFGQQDTDKLQIAESPGSGPLQQFLSDCAKEFQLWLVGGTVPLATAQHDKVSNTTLVYNPQGACVARYDKIHLFRFAQGQEQYDETRVLLPGHQCVALDVPSRDGHTWRVGLSICYDLRFPELYRALQADLLLVPSAFTATTGQAHWEVLLRARAIENLAYLAAAAQGGLHTNGRSTWGHSMLIDPWGSVMASHSTGQAVVMADLDFAGLASARNRLPALSHRVL